MRIEVLTLFPEIYKVLETGIIGRAVRNGIFEVRVTDIRDYSSDKHKKCDDYPYGGGAGMVMTPQPLHDAINSVDPQRKYRRIYLSPKGKTLNRDIVVALSKEENLMLINGSYEGIDQRIVDLDIDAELSIGDYVLTSGDFASLVVIDAMARYLPDVLGNADSTVEESFSDGLLEYPQYTRPREFMGLSVPEVLLNGNHAEIARWRAGQSRKITSEKRPDLLEE